METTPMYRICELKVPVKDGRRDEYVQVPFNLDQIIMREGYSDFIKKGTRFDIFEIEDELAAGAQGVAYTARLAPGVRPADIGYEGNVLPEDLKFVVKLPNGYNHKTNSFDPSTLVKRAVEMNNEIEVFKALKNGNNNIVHMKGYISSPLMPKSVEDMAAQKSLHRFVVPAIIMEYVEASSRKKHNGKYNSELLLDYLAGCANALMHMNRNGFLYGDFKPDNLIIRTDGQPILVDLGSARRKEVFKPLETAIKERDNDAKNKEVTDLLTDVGLSSVIYTAPELVALYGGMDVSDVEEKATFVARAPGGKSEAYAICATVYELMTGLRPFEHIKDSTRYTGRELVNEKNSIKQLMGVYSLFAGGVSPFDYDRISEDSPLARMLKKIVIQATQLDNRKRLSLRELYDQISHLYAEHRGRRLGPERREFARKNGRKINTGTERFNSGPVGKQKQKTNGNSRQLEDDFEVWARERRKTRRKTDNFSTKE
ncbi:hypothetical protein GF371_02220 [Candidatus Woesearchaeota archaeon]|nr:hypothetical protein [Candidatus Woesearchaeota archaeon]